MNDPAPPDRRELPLELLDQIDRICDRFEAAWESDTRPRIEDHLDEVPAAYRLALLSDLLAAELAACRRRGEQPEPREYADRFPEDPETIAAALAVPPDRRAGETFTAQEGGIAPVDGDPDDTGSSLDGPSDGRRFRVLRPHARGASGPSSWPWTGSCAARSPSSG